MAVGLAGLVAALYKAFPDAMETRQDWADVAYYAGFALVLAAGAWRVRGASAMQLLSHVGVWLVILGILALGYAYRGELAGVPQHLELAFGTDRPVVTGAHELVIPEDDHGAFEVVATVDGQPVRFVVDTGSTDTVLTPRDARRLGVDLSRLRFDEPAETANGTGFGAPYVAHELEVGPIRLSDVKMEINKAPMTRSLLGLSFLNRLDSFEIKGRRLYLTWGSRAGA